jgi:methionyl-tRNA formyltransferase
VAFRVIYFGTPEFAAPTLKRLLASSHTVVGVVTQPDRARGRGQKVTFSPVKTVALEHGVPVLQPEKVRDAAFLDELRAFNADIGVVAAYGKILPQALLDIPPEGLINVHASLLPRWRGAAPIHRAIQAGDAVTGVTIMRVALALDAGPMLKWAEVPIGPDATSVELERTLSELGADLLVSWLDQLTGGLWAETLQEEAEVTYAHRLERKDGQIDWTRPALAIHNQIRGLHPWPMASVMWRGKRLILRRSRVTADPSNGAPGTIVAAHGEDLLVATGTTLLRLVEVQMESGRPQTAREFLNGAHATAGDRFEPIILK